MKYPIYSKLIAVILFLFILLVIWLLITSSNNYTIQSNFSNVSPIATAINTEYNKLANSLTSLNIAKIKYNLTH